MRRISLNEVTDDMTLAKPIYQGTKLILQTGVAGIPKYKEKLNNVGIFPYMSTILSLMISQFLTWYVNRPEKMQGNLASCLRSPAPAGQFS